MEEKIITELVKLPRDEQGNIKRNFEANGHKYIIRKASEVLTLRRNTELNRMGLVAATGLTFAELINKTQQSTKAIIEIELNENFTLSKMKPILINQGIEEALVRLSKENYDAILLYCTIFIVRENEDIRYWDYETQIEKVNDWNEGGFDVNDFFILAVCTIPNMLNQWNLTQEAVKIRLIPTLSE